jgi:hypothetical protein
MDYFLVLNVVTFSQRICPPLAQSWRLRSFEPCRELCRELLPNARSYAERYHIGTPLPLLHQMAENQEPALHFDRTLWKQLVGEVLLFAAVEIPEFQTAADAFCCLLAPDLYRAGQAGIDPADRLGYLGSRDHFAPIQQALWGSRDLTFGSAVYRPDHAGLNLSADIERLTEILDEVDPLRWREADLREVRNVSEEDRGEELAFAREWFPVLRDLFRRVRENAQILIHEQIY